MLMTFRDPLELLLFLIRGMEFAANDTDVSVTDAKTIVLKLKWIKIQCNVDLCCMDHYNI